MFGIKAVVARRGLTIPVSSARLFSTCRAWQEEKPTFGTALKQGVPKKKPQAKKSSLETIKYVLHGNFGRNNTHLTLTKVQLDKNHELNFPEESFNDKVLYYLTLPQKVVMSASTGNLGFRKAQRGEYEAAYQLSSFMFTEMRNRKVFDECPKLEVVLRQFGKGRQAFLEVLTGKNGAAVRDHVTKISDLTPIKFGGTKSPTPRRL